MSGIELDDFFKPIYTKGSDGITLFKMFINGVWFTSLSEEMIDVDTPIDGSVIAKVANASKEDVERAIDAAYESRQKIRAVPGIERIEIFEKASELLSRYMDDFVRTLMLEAGKPRRDAEGEVRATIDRLKLTMQESRKIFGEYVPGDWSDDATEKIALVIREPVGVVVAISPFNYPLYIVSAKIIPALLAGNTVVSKQSSENPLSLLLFARILKEAGIPDGTLNVVTGSGTIGDHLVPSEKVSMINFTGSTEVGSWIAKIAGLKKLHLELGGKGMAIVLDDADLDLAAKKCVEGSLKNAGQRCDAISSVLVAESIIDKFVEKVIEVVKDWKHGDPRDPSTKVGPVINIRAAKRIQGLIDDARAKGAKLLVGGSHKDCYFEPTVLYDVPLEARIAWEETFGPVITIIKVKDEDDAIEIGKKSRYGLDSCVFTNNFYKMWKIAKRLETGEVTINDLPRHGVGYFPFGGSKESGIGREGIGYSIDEMTNLKTIVFNLEPAKLGKVRRIYRA
ncbi:MAG: aldehyde dehydrogenase family protein [Candidatus Methylarchaceae archaeon HK01B]|nr:aldehyde dehydrogenase family protein [Candidatus Methylarchaceae archaeon HK02M1]MCP8318765.1 aldehyde dehydrogenase family protein [Candidatus Methylarchaceae archaeon HK01B]